jgi:sigma-E factor negative regulatory protein RseA
MLPHDDPSADETSRLLSALADGDPAALPEACEIWRKDDRARQTWHAYHLIGDVLRSDDLAHPPERDAAFLAALRTRLAAEPAVLAPAAAPRPSRSPSQARGAAWRVPAAAVAGVVVVAGALAVARIGEPALTSAAPTLTAGSVGGVTLVSQALRRPATQRPGNDGLIRDARLDEYLRAHQAARGGIAVAAPGGTLRRLEGVVPVSVER